MKELTPRQKALIGSRKAPRRHRAFRLTDEDTARLGRIREALGLDTDTSALRYALTQMDRLIRR
jgi:hypothetical protein